MQGTFKDAEKDLLANPVFSYLAWRSQYLVDWHRNTDFRNSTECPICGQAITCNDFGIITHLKPVESGYCKERRVSATPNFYDIYWGMECQEMSRVSWRDYQDDLPELEYYANWKKNYFGGVNFVSVRDLFWFINRVAWRKRNEERVKKGYQHGHRGEGIPCAQRGYVYTMPIEKTIIEKVRNRKCVRCGNVKALNWENWFIAKKYHAARWLMYEQQSTDTISHLAGRVCRKCYEPIAEADKWLKKKMPKVERTDDARLFARNMIKLNEIKKELRP